MGRPAVKINYLNGQLGGVVRAEDRVAGLILSGVAESGIALLEPKQVFSLEEAVSLGIAVATNPLAYQEISDFYKKAGKGSELWIMLVVNTTLLADISNKNNNIARKLLDAADGRIRRLGINRKPPVGYSMVNTECVDTDVLTAKINLQELLVEYQAAQKPFRAMLPHLGFDKTKTSNLHNFRQDTHNGVNLISWSAYTNGQPSVGFSLGWWVSLPVHRNLGRVKNGDVGLLDVYFPDGTPIKELETKWDGFHDKGMTFLIRHYTRSGWYFVNDYTCSPATDDYNQLSRGTTIDLARVVLYNVLIGELLDDVEVDEDGNLPESVVLGIQSECENAIVQNMRENISGKPTIIIPSGQNFLATNKINMQIKIRPRGQFKDIEADLSFDNPMNHN